MVVKIERHHTLIVAVTPCGARISDLNCQSKSVASVFSQSGTPTEPISLTSHYHQRGSHLSTIIILDIQVASTILFPETKQHELRSDNFHTTGTLQSKNRKNQTRKIFHTGLSRIA
jgi:hypothetical protein